MKCHNPQDFDNTQDRMDDYTRSAIEGQAAEDAKGGLDFSGQPAGPKYPHVEVSLVGRDGNAFAILGAVGNALRAAHVSQDEINDFYNECGRGDYDHLLRTVMSWVTVS